MVIVISIIALVLEFHFSPRIGFTRENKVLLWYGKRTRKYVVIF